MEEEATDEEGNEYLRRADEGSCLRSREGWVCCQLHSSLKTWIVKSDTRFDKRLLRWDKTICSLASLRTRTWIVPTILFHPRDQKCSFLNSRTPSIVEASLKHLSRWLIMWTGVVWRRIFPVKEVRGKTVMIIRMDKRNPNKVSEKSDSLLKWKEKVRKKWVSTLIKLWTRKKNTGQEILTTLLQTTPTVESIQ